MKTISLNGSWTMHKKGCDKTYPATVPTTMYQVLYQNGLIEDPFYGENDRRQVRLSDDDYVFTKDFDVEASCLLYEKLDMAFLGLDTLASIYLNDRLVAKTDNMHRTYTFDVKKDLKPGANKLEIVFASPTKYIAKEQAKDPLWGVVQTIPGYEHLRKAHHMFGWDWGPKMPDMGIWREVYLRAYNEGKIKDVYLVQNHEEDLVTLEVATEVTLSTEDLQLSYALIDEEGHLVASEVIDAMAQGNLATLVIEDPKLWWPNGYGDHYLYTLKVHLLQGKTMIDEDIKQIGLRTMTTHREEDKWGESFDFKINGLRIFAMGADYIPEDTLMTRPTEADTERLIKDCVKANYNCLRVWGGGIYPSNHFYELCDRYGLIVWQDFMFACGVYRLTEKFEANIRAELIDNIKRLRHHASLGLWCGNNEMEWGFVEWPIPKDERLRMDYLLMYEKLIPDVLAVHDPQTFYWPASPSSGGGFDQPNADHKGDVHYWEVFHGNEHYKKFRDHYFRFASEYGMQALPDMKTIQSYTAKEDRNLFSPVMENHNKCIEPMNGNVKILLNMAQEFKLPTSLEDQVYISQVFQGETIRCAVEHYRRNRGRCMGSTYWQVNDNYPVASWSSIDYYGRWKALHYMARRFYAPVLITAYEEGLVGHLHVSNDRPTAFDGKVCWQIRQVDGAILETGDAVISLKPLAPAHIVDVDVAPFVNNYGDDRRVYVSYQLYEGQEALASETLLFVPHKYFDFKEVTISYEVTREDQAYYVTVTSDGYTKALGLQTHTTDLIFSDNYFDLLPGQVRKIKVDDIRSESDLSLSLLSQDIYLKAVNTARY